MQTLQEFPLDLHGEILLEQYHAAMPAYEAMRDFVSKRLKEALAAGGIEVNTQECRIKTEGSLVGKLKRKGSKYATINDITDILGVRVVVFYNEDVDKTAAIVKNLFEIDWANSIDKRKTHDATSFGYNSLHYICRIPKTLYQDESYPELNEIRFELQMRTILQHTWSAIQHDIGYKMTVEIPEEYHRRLGRLAGLLELADDEFSRIRADINDYRRRKQSLVSDGKLDEVPLDGDTYTNYLALQPFDKLNKHIAAINQAEILPASLESYLGIFKNEMGFTTLADIETMIRQHSEDAYQLACWQLGNTDLDILSASVGPQNLCIVHLLRKGGGKADLARLLNAINGQTSGNEQIGPCHWS